MTSRGSGFRLGALRWSAIVERPSPIVKQVPTVLLLGIGVVIVAIAPAIVFTSVPDTLFGVAGIGAATVLAVVMTVRRIWDGWVVLLVPMVDILALGLFRSGTGGPASLFGGFILLPVIWLASAPQRRYIAIAVGLAIVALLFPYFRQPPEAGDDWLRGFVTPLVFAMVAFVVNELVRLGRRETQKAERLAAFREAALQENSEVLVRAREAEQSYRLLLAEFQSVWDATTAQAVVSTDVGGVVVRWNPGAARLFGRTEAEVRGELRVDALFPPEALELLADGVDAVPGDPLPRGIRGLFALAEAGEPVDRDLELFGAHGTIVPMRLTLTARRDDADQLLGFLLVATDETRAAEVSRMKDEFVGMVSHELRTPLTSILGYLDLLQHDATSPLAEDQRQFLDIVERNARRLLKLVNDLLFTAQVGSGRFPLELHDGDLGAVVAAAIESARPAAERAGVAIELRLPERPATARFDPDRIGQAVDNLLSNAIKFTPSGGHVTVEVATGDATATVAVHDTGVGIPDDEQRQLFTRFFRASTATRNAIPGIGLGLTITKAIVVAHGGWMDVSSREGEGTEIRFSLPRQAGSGASRQQSTLEGSVGA